MTREEVLTFVDHTLLSSTATWTDIQALCDDGLRYRTASVCIPPAYVAQARAHVGDRLAICTVIGFPNGYMTTAAKLAEAEDALRNGAAELDMVVHLGDVKAGHFDRVESEIAQLKKVCGDNVLKVIVEACLLTQEEKLRLCEAVTQARADFIKTSTGFSTGGATLEDVRLFREHVGADVRVKAAGGIKSFETAEAFIQAGASRLGTSSLVTIMKTNDAGTGTY